MERNLGSMSLFRHSYVVASGSEATSFAHSGIPKGKLVIASLSEATSFVFSGNPR